MRRKRSEMYYLDLVRDGNYVFYADNTVGLLGMQEITKTIEVPTRIDGKSRTQEMKYQIPNRTGEITTLHDLARDRSVESPAVSIDGESDDVLEFIPGDVVSEMREWQCGISRVNVEAVRGEALGMIASDEALQTEQVHCADCRDDQYACYTSGWSKHFWKYPMIDVGSDELSHLVPLDIAQVINLNPEALTIDDKYKLVGKDLLVVNRVAALRLDVVATQMINLADQYAGKTISVVLDSWGEEGTLPAGRSYREQITGGPARTPADVIRMLQSEVTQGGERVELTDYQARWAEVRSALGASGLALTWQYGYRGMGDSDAWVYTVDQDTIKRKKSLTSSPEARMMVDDAHRALVQHKNPLFTRPEYTE